MRTNKFYLLLLLFTSFLSITALSQQSTLKGVIFDESNGETIPLVNIVKVGTLIGTSSNDYGAYELELTPGEHEIKFSSIGYKDSVLSISLDPDEILTIDI